MIIQNQKKHGGKLMKGKFITIEGCDGSGKTAQKRLLVEYLIGAGIDFVQTREPGGTDVSEKIRELILDKNLRGMQSLTELMLYTACRIEHINTLIKPSIEAGKYVICDRFIDSTIAYQGFARGLGQKYVEKIFELTTPDSWPDVTLFLNVPPEVAFIRKGGIDTGDRIENETSQFHQKVYEGFVSLSKIYSDRIIDIDASKDKYTTNKLIIQALKDKGII